MVNDVSRAQIWWTLSALIGVLSLLGLWSERAQHGRATTDAEAQGAVEWVRSGFEAGDAVCVVPSWDDGPWDGLRGAGRGTERFPYPALLRGDFIDPVDVGRHRRLWVLYTQGAEITPPARAVLGVEEARETFGDTVVGVRYAIHEMDLRGRLSELREAMTVTRHRANGEVLSCPLRGPRFACGQKAWMDVRTETRDVDHMEASWLYAHPGPVEAELRLEWRELPASQALLLRVGHTLEAVRRDRGTPASIIVRADEHEIDRFTLERHAYTHERRLYEWAPDKTPQSWTISVVAEDADWREVMLDGDLLGEVPQGVRATATATKRVSP
jgi:hypothetical protein